MTDADRGYSRIIVRSLGAGTVLAWGCRMAACRLSPVAFLPLLLFAASGMSSLRAAEIWLAPQASVPPSPLNRAVDFLDLFTPDAPWEQAAGHVKVFALYTSFVGPASQDQIDKIVADLKRRQMAIALEAGVMNIGPKSTNPPCGGFGLVEGYGTPASARNVSEKIKKAGGAIAYLAMDEPLWYGHYFKGRPGGQPGCQSSIDEIVKLAGPTLAAYREEFPDIVVGDIEPTNVAEQPNWQNDLAAWANGFRTAMGKPLAFMHFDVLWERPNEDNIFAALFHYAETLKRQGLIGRTGIIYNGSPRDKSDQSWVRSARDHIVATEEKAGLRPDQAIIQSWAPNPTHAMPETSADTLTSLVNFYVGRNKR
jgi:hypothetical protein